MVREMGVPGRRETPRSSCFFRETEILLGTDRAGDQVSIQETMRPMFVFFLLMVEMMALASLVATEIQQRTVTAILGYAASVTDVLVAKAILGTALAFSQAVAVDGVNRLVWLQQSRLVVRPLHGSDPRDRVRPVGRFRWTRLHVHHLLERAVSHPANHSGPSRCCSQVPRLPGCKFCRAGDSWRQSWGPARTVTDSQTSRGRFST